MSGSTHRAANVVVAMLVALSLGVAGCTPEGVPEGEAAVLKPAPAFTLEQLGGGSVSLADLQGKTVILDFWATWCPPCEFQVPELNRFYEAHRDDSDVVIFGVSVDADGAGVVQSWVGEKQVHYPILLKGEDLARDFGAVGFPTLYVISPDGDVLKTHVGLVESGELEEALAEGRRRSAS